MNEANYTHLFKMLHHKGSREPNINFKLFDGNDAKLAARIVMLNVIKLNIEKWDKQQINFDSLSKLHEGQQKNSTTNKL